MNIVIIDDDRALCRSLQIHLNREGHTVQFAGNAEEGLALVRDEAPDLAFVDLKLPDYSGMEILRTLREENHPALVVMITGVQDARSTIEAIRLGAFDYIRKPLDLDAVQVTIEKASKHMSESASDRDASSIPPPKNKQEIIGGHPAVIEILKQVAFLSSSRIPVLVQGESGTGKELVARALHEAGAPQHPFVAVNCSALVSTLLESELFGHEKGAFTGADAAKPGKLEYAGKGTLFLDEIGDMSPALQAKVLRALQEREFERVGGTRTIPFRARVVAASNKGLRTMVEQGVFRSDLYYRLAVSTIHVPPLRDRRSDIPLLARHLVGQLAEELHKDVQGIEEDALQHLCTYDWPGNVRELGNVLTRAMLLARNTVLEKRDIQLALGQAEEAAPKPDAPLRTLREAEKAHVEKALLATGWNIKRTAELLEVSRVTLRKKIEDYHLSPPPGYERNVQRN